MPIKLNSPGGGSISIDVPNMSTANTIVLPLTSSGSSLVTNNYTGSISVTGGASFTGTLQSGGALTTKTGLFETTTANGCVYIQALPANNGSRIDSYNYPITTARPLVINSSNTRFWINDSESVVIDSDGRVNLYGGGGGSQLRLRNGGDLTIYSAGETYGCTIWNDPPTAGMDGAGQYLWTERLNLYQQRCGYDRLWDNYPSISVRNDTTIGPQGEFRLHGINGISGGDFSAALRCDGGFITGSDARRKVNVENIDNPLERTLQLSGMMFNVISKDGNIETDLSFEPTGKKFGLIAQDAIKIIPECIKFYPEADTPNANGWASAYSVDYPSVSALLIETIKVLNEKIESMQVEIDTLKGKN